MKSFDVVMNEYIASSTELVGDKFHRRAVPNDPPSAAELEIKTNLPAILSAAIQQSGRQAKEYLVYGSVGQTNFPFARIPWVAALHRKISTSPERGYYIVLLFREDMSGAN
jgi:5-methylcytosine-specific restriction enzyme A